MVIVTKVPGSVPAVRATKPAGPGGVSVRVKLSEELLEKGRVLGLDREDPQAALLLRNADIAPSNFAATSVAGFLPSPKEGPASFINGLNNTSQ
jgi:hypothetical protein